MISRQAIPKIDKVDVVPQNWGNAREAFEDAYKHECHVSKLIDLLVKIASEEKDNATQNFLWGFVREQVEEEAKTLDIVDKMKRSGEAGMFFLNYKLAER
jgi:ferritin